MTNTFPYELPLKRAAYSDRTALLMAKLSELVYKKFPDERKADFEENESKDEIESELKNLRLKLLSYFNKGDSQAMLVKYDSKQGKEDFIALVFRGTEANIADIRSDLKFNLVSCKNGGKVHNGFLDAFQDIELLINQELSKHEDTRLYIAGHSLGGALAVIATNYLSNDNLSATYTFGAPRVGDDEFYEKIFTPVYRIVNSSDIIPRTPVGAGLVAIILNLLVKIKIPFVKFIRNRYFGYTHHGNYIYIEKRNNNNNNVKIKKSPDGIRISIQFISSVFDLKSFGNNHRMTEYVQALESYAKKRMAQRGN